MSRELSEDEAFALAREAECPVLGKEEIGAARGRPRTRIWFFEELAAARREYEALVTQMRTHGLPF